MRTGAGKNSECANAVAGLIETANKHHDMSYTARAFRLLAEIDMRQGDNDSAAQHVAKARECLRRCEAWNVEWRIHATAARVLVRLGRSAEAAESRELSRRAAQRVADTLVDEPALQRSFLNRLTAELGEAAASA